MSIMRSAGIKSTLASFVEVVLFFCVLSVIYFVVSYVIYAAIAMPRARAHTAQALAASQANTLKAETELNEAIQSEIDDLAAADTAKQAFDAATEPLYDDPAFADLLKARDEAQIALEADPENTALQAARAEAQIALDEAPKAPEIQAAYDEARIAFEQAQSQARSAARWHEDRLDHAIKTATDCGLLMLTEAIEDASELQSQSKEAAVAADRITSRMDRFIAVAAPAPIASAEDASEENSDADVLVEDENAEEAAEEAVEELTPEQLAEQAAQAAQAAREARLANAEPLSESLGSVYADLFRATIELDAAQAAFLNNTTACNDALTAIVTAESTARQALTPGAEEATTEASTTDEEAVEEELAQAEGTEDAEAEADAPAGLVPHEPWAQAMTDQFLIDRNSAQLILTEALPGITESASQTRDQALRVQALAKDALGTLNTSLWARTLISAEDEELLAQMTATGQALQDAIDTTIAPLIQSAIEEEKELRRQQAAELAEGEAEPADAEAELLPTAWLRGEELTTITNALAPVELATTNANEFLTRLDAYCTAPTNRPVHLSDSLAAAGREQFDLVNELVTTMDTQLAENQAINPILLEELLEELGSLADILLADAANAQTALTVRRDALIDEATSMTNSIQDDAKRVVRNCNAALNAAELAAIPVVQPGQSYGQSFAQGLKQMRLGGLFHAQAPFFRLGRVFSAMPWWLWIVFGGLYIVFLMIYWAPSDDPEANICEVRAFVLFGLLVVALMLIKAEAQGQRVSHSVKLFFQLLT